jgi:hypothetical protein
MDGYLREEIIAACSMTAFSLIITQRYAKPLCASSEKKDKMFREHRKLTTLISVGIIMWRYNCTGQATNISL